MKMEFYFDEDKCKEYGISEECCLATIRKRFEDHNINDTIEETDDGVFEGTEDDFAAFATMLVFENCEWFQNTIGEWYWTMIDGGELIRQDMVALCFFDERIIEVVDS